jgi:glycosyltransferase involved in cell wall biosynthesis
MKEPLVSLIVPVYNVAPYLKKCLDSVQLQTYRNFEAILVNDGSTDDSLAICQSYAKVDSRFHVIDQPNAGVSACRNHALDVAEGKYLQFLDADDWLTEDATETFVHAGESTGSDLVISHFYRVAGDRVAQRGHIKKAGILTRQEYAEQMMKAPANYYYGVLWNKFFRRSIVEAKHLRCPEDANWCEDFLFNLDYIESSRLITAVPKPLYYYRKRMDSLVNTQTDLRSVIKTKKVTFRYYKDLYQKLDLYEEQKAGIYRYLIATAKDGAVGPLSAKLEKPLA